MNDIAIRVENLSKLYKIGTKQESYKTLRDTLASTLKNSIKSITPNRQDKPDKPEGPDYIWALKEVSFEVKRGEVVGIIGRNGAGKTTLLKVLSRITEPTEGYAEIHGRVGSLLEVGTGFHPELTGRENIYLNGAILGMKKAEIERKFDEIVAFAEIEKFIDTPVKHYSSGMYVRLAFAVAAHLEPEILLVDEVLAVGDFAFQKKCLGKMQQVSGLGRTVLFVSHNLTAIKSLCRSCFLLESGRLAYLGKPDECVNRYLAETGREHSREVDVQSRERLDILGTGLRFTKVRLHSSSAEATVRFKEPLVLEMEFSVLQPLSDVMYGFSIYAADQVQILQCPNTMNGDAPVRHLEPGHYRSIFTLTENMLAPGRYTVELGARSDKRQQDEVPDALQFEVIDTQIYESTWMEPVRGYFRPTLQWTSPERLAT